MHRQLIMTSPSAPDIDFHFSLTDPITSIDCSMPWNEMAHPQQLTHPFFLVT